MGELNIERTLGSEEMSRDSILMEIMGLYVVIGVRYIVNGYGKRSS